MTPATTLGSLSLVVVACGGGCFESKSAPCPAPVVAPAETPADAPVATPAPDAAEQPEVARATDVR